MTLPARADWSIPTDAELPGARGSGPLDGRRFAAKDLFSVAGHRSSFGVREWRNTHTAAGSDAKVVARLCEAGAEMSGIAVMDELAYSLDGVNAHFGTPSNSAAPGRTCGGSSCGSAAATAAGWVDFAIGTDTGGSIRVPASYCGLFGIRPTHGRVSVEGVIPLASRYDTVGWFARSGEDLATVGRVLFETRDPSPPVGHVVVLHDALELMEPEAREVMEDHISHALDSLRVTSSTHRLPEGTVSRWAELFRRTQAREIWKEHGRWVESAAPVLSAAVAARLEAARELAADGQEGADGKLVDEARDEVLSILGPGRAVLLPGAIGPAPELSGSDARRQLHRERTLRLTCLAGIAGAPQLVMPFVRCAGAPLGLSLMTAPHSDDSLLDLATRWNPEAIAAFRRSG